MRRNPKKAVGGPTGSQKVCFISPVDEWGYPNTEAMLRPRERAGIPTIPFPTNTPSLGAAQFRNSPKACLSFWESQFFREGMLRGTVEVLEEQPWGGYRTQPLPIDV